MDLVQDPSWSALSIAKSSLNYEYERAVTEPSMSGFDVMIWWR
jgi:hypothetical protein